MMKPLLRDSHWQGVDHTESGIFIDDWELCGGTTTAVIFFQKWAPCSHIEVIVISCRCS